MLRPALATCLATLCACVTAPISAVPIAYEVSDRPDQGGFELRYTNRTSRTLCLASNFWPNPAGKLNQAGDVVYVEVEGLRFHIEDFNTGYPDGTLRVSPGEEILGSLSYADFGLPDRLRNSEKVLEFRSQAFACDGSR